jgi:hypothetical protein
MNDLCQQHHNTGWNDTAHGILTWTDGCNQNHDNPLSWAINMKRLAVEMKPQAKGEHNRAYFDGVIACVEHYQKTGCMEKKLVL